MGNSDSSGSSSKSKKQSNGSNNLPPLPSNLNFPTQSSPKFQNSSASQHSAMLNTRPICLEDLDTPYEFVRVARPKPNFNGAYNMPYEHNNGYYDTAPSRQPGAVYHIVDNPVYCNDLPRPKVAPLTPLELLEYQRNGIEFKRTPVTFNGPKPRYLTANRYRNQPASGVYSRPAENHVRIIRRRNRSLDNEDDDRPQMPIVQMSPQQRVNTLGKGYVGLNLVARGPIKSMTSHEIDYLQRTFDRYICYDNKIDFRGFLRVLAQLHPNSVRLKNFCQTAIYFFQVADTNGDELINFEEFLLTYVEFRSSIGAIVTQSMRASRPPVYEPGYMRFIDKQTLPIEQLAKQINRSGY